MIYLKTEEEIELLRENNLLVSATLAEVGRNIKPGVTTRQLDKLAEEFIRSHLHRRTYPLPQRSLLLSVWQSQGRYRYM